MRWSVKKTPYLSVLLGGACAAGALFLFSRRDAAADAAGAPALPPVVHRLTGEVLHPLPPEELAALRNERTAARLRKAWAATPGETVEFLLGLRDESVLAALDGVTPVRVSGGGKTACCRAPRAVAERFLETLPEGVEWISPVKTATLLNAVAVSSLFLGLSEPLRDPDIAPTLDGRGEIIAMIDSGISTGSAKTLNADLLPPLYGMTVEPSVSGAADLVPVDGVGHGTHVAGSLVSQGTTYLETGGAAPGAHLLVQSIAKGSALHLADTDAEHVARSYAAGARIVSCSWKRQTSGLAPADYGYDASTAGSLDTFVWEHPDTVICFAAGNDGTDKKAPYGVIDPMSINSYEAYAKNVIIVGAHESYRTDRMKTYTIGSSPIYGDYQAQPAEGTQTGMAAFSSRGPLSDGRIVPMVVTPGTQIRSTSLSGCGFDSGTSMATPLAAGSAAVLRQYLKECHGLESPTAAAVRAGLILCAETLAPGQYGTGDYREIPETSPNPVEGWGALRLGQQLAGPATLGFKDRIRLKTGESESFSVTIPEASAGEAFAAVLSWVDAPQLSQTYDRALVNDYDLTVTAPDGTVHSVGDALNPIERICIPSAGAGTYTVTVTGTQIAQDGAGNLAAVAWRAATAAGPVALPKAAPVPEETVTLTVVTPLRPYLDFPLYPAPGEQTFPRGTRLRVRSGARLSASDFGTTARLCGWILRREDGSVEQGSADSFDLTLDQNMTLTWYTLFPGYRFFLR